MVSALIESLRWTIIVPLPVIMELDGLSAKTLEAQVRELRFHRNIHQGEYLILQFKVDSLTQQLQLSQTEAERANHDLSKKTEEFTKTVG
jgi:nucleoprotein TPR